MRKEKCGTGITERTVVHHETAQEQADYLRKVLPPGNIFDFEHLFLKPVEAAAWRTLQKKKLTRTELEIQGEKWLMKFSKRHRPPYELGYLGSEQGIIATALRLTRDKPDSEEGYAARFLDKIQFIRRFGKRSNVDMMLRESFGLGALWTEAVMKFQWENDAMRAYKSRRAFIAGRNRMTAQARDRHARWQQMAADILAAHPRWSLLRAARTIAETNGVKYETVRKAISKTSVAKIAGKRTKPSQ